MANKLRQHYSAQYDQLSPLAAYSIASIITDYPTQSASSNISVALFPELQIVVMRFPASRKTLCCEKSSKFKESKKFKTSTSLRGWYSKYQAVVVVLLQLFVLNYP